jgi:hypothetical protein
VVLALTPLLQRGEVRHKPFLHRLAMEALLGGGTSALIRYPDAR